jgi:uncharacterized membrane protein
MLTLLLAFPLLPCVVARAILFISVVVALARAILFISVIVAVARAQYREPMECKGYKVNQRVFNIIIVTPLLILTLVIIIVIFVIVITLARAQYHESVKCKGKERVRSIQICFFFVFFLLRLHPRVDLSRAAF